MRYLDGDENRVEDEDGDEGEGKMISLHLNLIPSS